MTTEPAKGVSTDYLKLNKLGKIPTFEGQDGYVLTEAMAIAIYSEYTMPLHFHPRNDERSIFSVIPV